MTQEREVPYLEDGMLIWPVVITAVCRRGQHTWCGLSRCACACHAVP